MRLLATPALKCKSNTVKVNAHPEARRCPKMLLSSFDDTKIAHYCNCTIILICNWNYLLLCLCTMEKLYCNLFPVINYTIFIYYAVYYLTAMMVLLLVYIILYNEFILFSPSVCASLPCVHAGSITCSWKHCQLLSPGSHRCRPCVFVRLTLQ